MSPPRDESTLDRLQIQVLALLPKRRQQLEVGLCTFQFVSEEAEHCSERKAEMKIQKPRETTARADGDWALAMGICAEAVNALSPLLPAAGSGGRGHYRHRFTDEETEAREARG